VKTKNEIQTSDLPEPVKSKSRTLKIGLKLSEKRRACVKLSSMHDPFSVEGRSKEN
jgi:hypothetical protein